MEPIFMLEKVPDTYGKKQSNFRYIKKVAIDSAQEYTVGG